MKKWLPVASQYLSGVLIFLGYTLGLIWFFIEYSKFLVGKIGKNSGDDEIVKLLILIILTIIMLPLGNVILYKQFRKTSYPAVSKGIVLGLLLLLVSLAVLVSLNEVQQNKWADMAYMKAAKEQEMRFENARKEKEASLQEWEDYNKTEYAYSDSLKNAKDSLRNEKDWFETLPKVK